MLTGKAFSIGDHFIKNRKNEKNLTGSLSIWLCLCVAYGIIFDSLALGVGLGLCFGSIFGITKQKKMDRQVDK